MSSKATDDVAPAVMSAPAASKTIVCGPLINYRRIEKHDWIGSVLVVTQGGGKAQSYNPILTLAQEGRRPDDIEGYRLYADCDHTFWRFDLRVPQQERETRCEYTLGDLDFGRTGKPRRNTFFVPARSQSMRIMFHSCNGFSVGTDEAAWSGPCLWNDVMRHHAEQPFHVMLGGGDQIYNDSIRVQGPLKAWTDIGNPHKRQRYPFPERLRAECDKYYRDNYIKWFSTEPFCQANGQIPQLNIWDDHDIIDGFGSYVSDFMKCDVFRGIGGIAYKYYMLFQHQLPPPDSTYTTSAEQTAPESGANITTGTDPTQLVDTFVHAPIEEPTYIIGEQPGPYVAEHSHSVVTKLGARMLFVGIDARTERTRHEVNYEETYALIFRRLKQELAMAKASGEPITHVILLLGIPIAYPRLTWLENILRSPIIGPIKFATKRLGIGGGFFNHFDGAVDLLDDLDDHYTARIHKRERQLLVERLQSVSEEFSVRINILGGDVHLAAVGRFYSSPKLNLPVEKDFRYMPNIVSSAIVNKPPPQAIANLLARRNKIHYLNDKTDETLMNLFDEDPGGISKSAKSNRVTMPSRNFAIITENAPRGAGQPGYAGFNGSSAAYVDGPTDQAHRGPRVETMTGSSGGHADDFAGSNRDSSQAVGSERAAMTNEPVAQRGKFGANTSSGSDAVNGRVTPNGDTHSSSSGLPSDHVNGHEVYATTNGIKDSTAPAQVNDAAHPEGEHIPESRAGVNDINGTQPISTNNNAHAVSAGGATPGNAGIDLNTTDSAVLARYLAERTRRTYPGGEPRDLNGQSQANHLGFERLPDGKCFFKAHDGHGALSGGELHAGVKHSAAGNSHGTGTDGSLDIAICVEIDQHNSEGKTQAYGFRVPALNYTPPDQPRHPLSHGGPHLNDR